MLLKNVFSKAIICRGFSQRVGASSTLTADTLSGTDKGIVVLAFDNHKTKNALSRGFTESLYNVLSSISNDSSTRVLVLRSKVPKVFCAGADLKERLSMSESEVGNYVSFLRNLMFKLETVPVPTIAAIDGAALGGGLEMALACDIRIASESAKLGLVETKLAILPGAGGTQRLPRLIGASLAKELIFTARVLSGIDAGKLGLVNHCVASNDSGDSAYIKSLEVAREILVNGPLAIKFAKVAINKGQDLDIHQGCAFEELCYAQVIPTKDRIEGLRAFQDKRKPVYIGK